MSFVAAPPAAQPAPAVADMVAGDGWYPDLSIAAFRAAVRVGSIVTDARARDALVGAILTAHVELARWRARHVAAGATGLAAVDPADTVDGEPRTLLLWRRAVHAYAAADLVETHSDITAGETGRDRREERAAGAADHLRTATLAVRALVGVGRSRVRLL